MAEPLGKIDKPRADEYKHARRLYLVPLVYSTDNAPEEYREKCIAYWQQVTEQLANLESKAGKVTRIYHESVSQGGDEGMKAVQELNPSSFSIAEAKCQAGAVMEALEDEQLLHQTMDWGRCLMLGFLSETVAKTVSESYFQAASKRNQLLAERISSTLDDDSVGLLFIREGHLVQFPADIDVFSVFPPALDEIHRWLRDRATLEREKAED